MRYLRRNSKTFAYASFVRTEKALDEYGKETGEHTDIYSDPVTVRTTIGAPNGEEVSEIFGAFGDYTRIIIVYSRNIRIEKNTRLWLDGADISKSHNAIVTAVRPHLNCTYIAVKDVKVNA